MLDKEKDGSRVLRYLVFDCLVMDGKHLMQRSLDKRLGVSGIRDHIQCRANLKTQYLREHLYVPFKKLCEAYPDEVKYFPFLYVPFLFTGSFSTEYG